MVSNSAHADWNISMQKDEVKKINELQKKPCYQQNNPNGYL